MSLEDNTDQRPNMPDRVRGAALETGERLVPAGVTDGVQSLPRSGQVEGGDGCTDGSEQEPRTNHAGNPKCLPFPCQRHSGTSGHVDDRPDDDRERRKCDEDKQYVAHLSSTKRGRLQSPRSSLKWLFYPPNL
jgi:hypothetical protein